MAEASGGGNNDDSEASRNLDSPLNDFGLSKKSISNRRYSMQLYNLMLHVPFDKLPYECIAYVSGSSVEGVASAFDPTSDIDIMGISPINVINASDQIDQQVKYFPIQNGVYILEDSISHCLFKRLRYRAGNLSKNHYRHNNGYIYLSHAFLSDACRVLRERSHILKREYTPKDLNVYSLHTVENCGPSVATCSEATLWPSCKVDSDLVCTIFCPFWPNEIGDFFVRHRSQQWPAPRDLDLIIKNGCHFVAKGFEGSTECHIEWRLSFSFAENILIRSFNNIQMKCYYLLKMFLKKDIKPRFPKLLCSYHMKTVMFWICEEIGSNPFKKEFLLKCFRLCIDRISSYLLEGHFPCYFARESNLLSETVPSEAYRKLAEFLSIVYHEETTKTFVGYLKGQSPDLKLIHWICETVHPVNIISTTFKAAMPNYLGVSERKSTQEMQSFLNFAISLIMSKSIFNAYPEENILNVLRQVVFPDLSFTAIAVLRRRQLGNKIYYKQKKKYLQFMTNELAVTHSNGLLKRATVYYKTGQFTRCMKIAVKVKNLLTATHALCFGVHFEEIFRLFYQLQFGENVFPDGNLYISQNVTFSELDKPLVPDFVKEEINFDEHINDESTKGWAYFDPVIYAYGLAIICQQELFDFGARDRYLQELQYFFLQNKCKICYHNSAKRIIGHFKGQFGRQ